MADDSLNDGVPSGPATPCGWKITGPGPQLVGAGNSPLGVVGSFVAEIKIRIGSYSKLKRHRIIVAGRLTTPFLIGIELLSSLEILVDTKNRKVSFCKSSLTKGIFTISKEEVPARSQTLVPARVNHVGTIITGAFGQIRTANSVCQPKAGIIPVLILNPESQPLRINPNTQLASFEPLDEPQTEAVHNIVPLGKGQDVVQVGDNLSDTEVRQLKALLHEHLQAFSINGRLSNVKGHEHDIELELGARPFAEPLRRRAQVQIEETRKQIKELLEQGIIEDSNSPWASAYVLAQKKNGTWRLCIDFRRLNSMTKKVVYPLPHIEECLDTLSGKRYFSTVDFASGFWQISLTEQAKEKTAFRTEDGQFQFTKMPFGLCNAPASFQKMINGVLSGLKGLNLQVFIDDVCVATATWEEHLKILAQLFQAVAKANLKIKPDKCIFGADRVIFLGHEISREGIRQDPAKLAALSDIPSPKDPKEVRQFLGMCSYYRRFVPSFALIAEPLTRLTRKNITFEWTPEHQAAKDQLIDELKRNATLAHFTHRDPVMLKTDASPKGIAGILLQEQDHEWKLISCCSRRLTPAESNYGITDLEGLAMVYAVTKFRLYLLGKRFKIIVDHCALCSLNKHLPNSARLRRWAITLSEFDYEIIYTKGQLHMDVDCLSRAPVSNHPDAFLDHCVYSIVTPLDPEEWIDDYGADQESQDIFARAQKGEDSLELRDDIIYRDGLLYVPQCRRDDIVKEVHQSRSIIHPGVEATLSKLREHYWWPGMTKDVQAFVGRCLTCAKHKPNRSQPAGQMHSFEFFEPGYCVAVDSFGPITTSLRGNQHVIVAIDMFTRFVELKAVPDIKGITEFLLEYCGRYGVPRELLSYRSWTFCNASVSEVCRVFGIKHPRSTPYHHEGNAVAERSIQVLQEKLRLVMEDNVERANWDLVLPLVQLAMNTNIHRSTDHSPFQLTYGVKPPFHATDSRRETKPTDLHYQMLQSYMEQCRAKAVAIQSMSQEKAKERYDSKRKQITFQVGDDVMVRAPADRRNKLAHRYNGPYQVVSNKQDIYQLKDPNTSKTLSRHVSDLKPFAGAINLLLLLSLFMVVASGLSNAQVAFDRVRPVVWGTSPYKVALGTAFYDMNFAYHSPCKSFSRAITTHAGTSGTDDNITRVGERVYLDPRDTDRLFKYEEACEALYNEEWIKVMEQFLQDRPSTDSRISKRSTDHQVRPIKLLTPEDLDNSNRPT